MSHQDSYAKNKATDEKQMSESSTLELYMREAPFAIRMKGITKEYRIGQIGYGTLKTDFQSWIARKRGKLDPNTKLANEGRYVGKDRFMALNGVDLEIRHGETVGLIGANGAGKSTLLKLLSRVTAPTDGKIEIYGRIASMLEVGTGFNGELTGRENIYMNGTILGMTKEEIDKKMDAIIEFSEIGKHIDTPVKRYSSGMFVKLGFAVAANLDAEIMIMDEVLAVGDMAFQKKCIDKMHGIEEEHGKTIIYVSHNMDTIKRLCERCIVMNQGKVIFDGPADEAISLYMGINGAFSHHYEYPESCHSRMRFRMAVIETLEFPKSFSGQLPENEKIKFRFTVRGKRNVKEAYFRLEIVNAYGNIVGMMVSQNGVPLREKQSTTVDAVMDSTHLAPGSFRVNIAAFSFTELADKVELDKVEGAFTFEILYNDMGKDEPLAHWFTDWNSNVCLKPLLITEG